MMSNNLVLPFKIATWSTPALLIVAARLKATTATATTASNPEQQASDSSAESSAESAAKESSSKKQRTSTSEQQLKQMMEKFAQEQFDQGMKAEAAEQERARGKQSGSGVWDKVGRVFNVIGNVAFYGMILAGGYFGYYTYKYSTKEVKEMVDQCYKEEDPTPAQQAWAKVMEWYIDRREWAELQMKEYVEPSVDVLLPPIPEQYRRFVNTIVLDLDEVLVYSDWSRARGWKHFKRPGATEFLEALYKSGYEIVVYTDQLNTYADPLLNKLDKEMIYPDRYIGHRLYQSSTVLKGGKRYRDLNRLGRDMTRVLYVTANSETTEQKENMILVKPWKMENNDTVLLDLIPFFEMVSQTNVKDLRDIVKSYEGEDIVSGYKERLKNVQEQQQQQRTRRSYFGGR
eukprot:TRINITY_DN82_c0_g1_i1.p1 TRINITY_DN82_c0_g1~~TRINITY_DN82_c0_g1_i1.p1  ORF type:complete len:401 (-),score=62.75 TRINITY_DN82_c0_g1_i1:433-1635(-)